jgi:flagellar biosynthesis regulator FlaF
MSLAIFVDRQTTKALAKPSEDVFDSLINININISEGLMEGIK